MKYILMVEIETDAQLEIIQEPGAMSMELKGGWWKPKIIKSYVFKSEGDEEVEENESGKALKSPTKALKSMTPFNMGMHTGMSLVGSND